MSKWEEAKEAASDLGKMKSHKLDRQSDHYFVYLTRCKAVGQEPWLSEWEGPTSD